MTWFDRHPFENLEDFLAITSRSCASKLNRLARSPTILATSDHDGLPLHVQNPPVPLLDWGKADEVIRLAATAGEAAVWFELGAALRDSAAAQALYDKRDASLDVRDSDRTRLQQGDIDLLLSSGFCVPLTKPHVACVRLFAVVEPKKKRRRLIGWPRALNSAERALRELLKRRHADVPFPRAQDVRDKVRFRFAAQLDLKKFFQQFGLDSKEFFAVNLNGKFYGLSTIPTGGVAPPLIAQALTRTVCALAVRLSNTEELVFYDCMIDNLRLVSDNYAALVAAWAVVIRILDDLNITIGDIQHPHELMPEYTFLGMRFNHSSRVVRPAEGLDEKLAHAAQIVAQHEAPGRELQAVFGVCIWASLVVDFPLRSVYHVFKFMRRRSRMGLDDSMVDIWPSIHGQWAGWIQSLRTATFTHTARDDRPEATLFTDACLDGWGMVCFEPNGATSVFGESFQGRAASYHINEKELLAVKYAVNRLKHLRPGTRITLFIDNKAAQAWVQNRRAERFRINATIDDIFRSLQDHRLILEGVLRVPSADNPADAPSRAA